MGKTKKTKRKSCIATKVTKIPKTKRQKYGMNETKVICFLKGDSSCFFKHCARITRSSALAPKKFILDTNFVSNS
jgi:hypothetical protein